VFPFIIFLLSFFFFLASAMFRFDPAAYPHWVTPQAWARNQIHRILSEPGGKKNADFLSKNLLDQSGLRVFQLSTMEKELRKIRQPGYAPPAISHGGIPLSPPLTGVYLRQARCITQLKLINQKMPRFWPCSSSGSRRARACCTSPPTTTARCPSHC